MDDVTRLERRLADDALRVAGPSRPVDDAATFTAITATQSPTWRFGSLFSATRFFVAGAIVAIFGGFLILEGPVRDLGERVGSANATPANVAETSAPDPWSPHRHRLDVDGIALSIEHVLRDRPSLVWSGLGVRYDAGTPPYSSEPDGPLDDRKDGLYLSVSTHGPQGAEAMILWTTFPGGDRARPCLLDPDITSAEGLVASMATAPGVEVVRGPSDVTVGSLPGKFVALTVVPPAGEAAGPDPDPDWEPGCDPAYFFGWEPYQGGVYWANTDPGDSIRLWVVEVDSELLVIEVETKPDAGDAVEDDIAAFIDSVRFE